MTVRYRQGYGQFDASRRGKKGLRSCHDRNEDTYRGGEGEKERACLVTLDLSYTIGSALSRAYRFLE